MAMLAVRHAGKSRTACVAHTVKCGVGVCPEPWDTCHVTLVIWDTCRHLGHLLFILGHLSFGTLVIWDTCTLGQGSRTCWCSAFRRRTALCLGETKHDKGFSCQTKGKPRLIKRNPKTPSTHFSVHITGRIAAQRGFRPSRNPSTEWHPRR